MTEVGVDAPEQAPVDTIFGKIARKEIPANIVYEDDLVLAFRDISPQAPIHIVIIPKIQEIPQLSKAQPKHKEVLGHLLLVAGEVARKEQLHDGFRIVINDGKKGCQHLHLLGGRQLGWPPG